MDSFLLGLIGWLLVAAVACGAQECLSRRTWKRMGWRDRRRNPYYRRKG